MKTIDAAAGKWPSLLEQFGVDRGALDGKHHPCPCSGDGIDRFRFADRNGSGSFFCACSNDGRGGGFALLQCKTGRDFADLAKEVDKMLGNDSRSERPDKADPLPLLRNIQARVRKPGDAVREYLAGRKLECPDSLREIPDLEYWNDGAMMGRYPSMLGKIVDREGKPMSWHVTYLEAGAKAKAKVRVPRKVLPPVKTIRGCAIRLYPQGEVLGIAEGIETAIAAHMIASIPVWACISRGGLETFEPPEGVKEIVVLGDNDASFAGQAGAYKAAENLKRQGYAVQVAIPQAPGDWNDALLGGGK